MSFRRKLVISLLSGLIYWVLFKIITRFVILDALVKGTVGFLVIPGIMGVFIVTFFKEKRYIGVIHSIIPILIFYVLDILANVVLISAAYNPLKASYLLFVRVGMFSLISAIVGGVVAIVVNRKRGS